MTSPAGLPPSPLITDAMYTTVRGFTHVFRGSAESKRVICSFPCLFDGTYCSVPCGHLSTLVGVTVVSSSYWMRESNPHILSDTRT